MTTNETQTGETNMTEYTQGYEAQKSGKQFDVEASKDWRKGWLDAWGGC